MTLCAMQPDPTDTGVLDQSLARQLTAQQLADMFPGTSRVWWQRRFSELRDAGVLRKIGRKHFGRPERVAAWLTGE